MTITELIKKNEGFKKNKAGRFILYRCTANKLTTGYGRNAEDNGFSQDEVDLMVENDISEAIKDLRRIFKHLSSFTQNRQIALIDMMFNLGYVRFSRFKKMISAIKKSDWIEAANQAKDSRWYNQVGARAERNVLTLAEG